MFLCTDNPIRREERGVKPMPGLAAIELPTAANAGQEGPIAWVFSSTTDVEETHRGAVTVKRLYPFRYGFG